MITTTHRHFANVDHSRSETTKLSIRSRKNYKLVQREPKLRTRCDRNRILFGKSVQLRGYYSEAEIEELRYLYPELILSIKKGFKRNVFKSGASQNKIPSIFPENFELIVEDQTKQQLLLEIHLWIFDRKINYCIVHAAFIEFLSELHWLTKFSDVSSDPLTLMVNSAMEYAKYFERNVNLASNLSQAKY